MKLMPLQVLSDSDLEQIHEATVHILAEVGVKIGSPATLDFLRGQGLECDGPIVRFPRGLLEDCLSHVPPTFEVFSRDGEPAFVLGDGTPRVAAGHNAVFWVDSETGATRPSTIADVALFARLCEDSPEKDMIGIPVMPQDVPSPAASLLYGVRAVIENSRKPIFFSTDRASVNRSVIEMCRAAFAGKFESQVYGISQLSPTSPLTWEPGVLEALTETAHLGVPLAILPEPNAGVSAPFTLAGLLTMNNAEALSGVILLQLLRPGAKLLYANSWTTTDMRTGAALVGSVETSLCRIAGAQLARFYGLPCHTTAPNSDNHAHDEQNSWEKTLSQFAALAAGNDLIVNCGMFATGLTCSHEQLLMDAEISANCRRLAAGIRVEEATIAADLIAEIGAGGSGYLTADHTMQWLRSEEYLTTKLAVRGPRTSWEAAGAKDTYALARDEVRAARDKAAPPFDPARSARLGEIIGGFA